MYCMKKTIIALIIIALIITGIYFIGKNLAGSPAAPKSQNTSTTTPLTGNTQGSIPPLTNGAWSVIGKSVEGRDILAYHYGLGTSTSLLFVGGIHGGYEWNTALVAYQLMDYLKKNPSAVPANVKVTVIPVLNPDGLNKVVGTTGSFTPADVSTVASTVVDGRFNANDVDLNRNFDCDWQTTGKWQSKTVSGGSAAFSEPESKAMENYINANKPTAVVVWYSAAGGVYSSSCHNGVSAETKALTNTFASASGYPAYESFDFYATTGDMVNWLAKINVPAISVLLTNHTSTEWNKNLAGVEAVIKSYNK